MDRQHHELHVFGSHYCVGPFINMISSRVTASPRVAMAMTVSAPSVATFIC